MNPREKFDGLVREFAGQIVSEVLQASLADVAPAAGVRLRNDSVDGSPVEVSGRPAKRRHITLTPKRRAALKVQGRYLGLMRRFNKDGQESIKKVGREQGNAAAIKMMEQSLRDRAEKSRKIVALQKSGKLTSRKIDRVLGIKRPHRLADGGGLLSPKQAAKYLGIGLSTLRGRIEKGILRASAIKLVHGERSKFFFKADLDRHLAVHPVRKDQRHGNRKVARR